MLHRVKGDKYIVHTKKEGGKLDWSHLAYELPSETRFKRKDRGKDKSDGKTRKKT